MRLIVMRISSKWNAKVREQVISHYFNMDALNALAMAAARLGAFSL